MWQPCIRLKWMEGLSTNAAASQFDIILSIDSAHVVFLSLTKSKTQSNITVDGGLPETFHTFNCSTTGNHSVNLTVTGAGGSNDSCAIVVQVMVKELKKSFSTSDSLPDDETHFEGEKKEQHESHRVSEFHGLS